MEVAPRSIAFPFAQPGTVHADRRQKVGLASEIVALNKLMEVEKRVRR
jgi:hypothetical protein